MKLWSYAQNINVHLELCFSKYAKTKYFIVTHNTAQQNSELTDSAKIKCALLPGRDRNYLFILPFILLSVWDSTQFSLN